MNQLTVVIASDTFAPDRNGTATFARNLAVGLHNRGYEVHVIAPATSKLYGTFREKHEGAPLIVHRLKSYRLPFQPTQRFVLPIGLTKRISGLLQAINPDVVHIQSHINVGHHAAIAASSLNKRLIATSHIDAQSLINNTVHAPKFITQFFTRVLLRDAARVYKIADAISAPTKRASQMLENSVKGLHVFPISGGVDLDRFIGIPKANKAKKKLIYIGRLDREKHVYVLLEAMAKIPSELGISLEIVGMGSQIEDLKRLALELGISKSVVFTGDLSDPEVVVKMGECSAFVMPSVQELQSMATLEAMAAGRPIIAANAMALPHLVHDFENGFLFEPDSPSDLAEKITKLFALSDSDFTRFSKASSVLARSHDLDTTVAVYERLYRGLPVTSTTLDNDPDYEAPISPTRLLVDLVRKGSKTLERGTNGVMERLDGVRGSVSESFSDVRFSIERRSKRARKKLSSSMRRILERIRRDD